MSLYTIGPLLGPALGPIAGGFITQTIGVRYVFIVIAGTSSIRCVWKELAFDVEYLGVSAIASLIGLPLLRETYAPVIRARRAKLVMDTEKGGSYQPPLSDMSRMEFLWANLTRPLILLTQSFICFILSAYMAL